jgi:MFS family permease
MYPTLPVWAFAVGGLTAILAGAVLWAQLPRPAVAEAERQGGSSVPLTRNLLSFGTAWCQGFLEGGMVGFLSLYLLHMGLGNDRVSWLTSSIMIGVILFQIPVATLAQRFGQTSILLGCYAVTIAGLCLLPFCEDGLWLVLWLFTVGACSGAFYPLGLTLLGQRVPSSGLARANAWFLAINCLGSVMGPGITGEVMEQFGERAMFGTGLFAVVLVLALWLIQRWYEASIAAGLVAPASEGQNSRERQAA